MFTSLRNSRGLVPMNIAALACMLALPSVGAESSIELAERPEQSARVSPALVVLVDGRRPATDYRKPANLVQAAGWGDLAAVEAMLNSGADVNAYAEFSQSVKWTTALIAAAEHGFPQVVARLLAAGADVNARVGEPRAGTKYGTTALMRASANGYAGVVQALLVAKADVNIRDEDGRTALLGAAANGRLEIVKALLAAKADPGPMSKMEGSALLLATRAGFLDVATLLVEAGANINALTDSGDSPLRIAALGRTPRHLAFVRTLLAHSADIEAGRFPTFESPQCAADAITAATPLGMGGWSPEFTAALATMIDPCRTDIMARKPVGTPLGYAVRSGSLEIVQALLAAKANVNARQLHWQTPLMIAVDAGRADVVRALLAAGANLSLKDNRDRTAAMLAAERGNPAIQAAIAAAAK